MNTFTFHLSGELDSCHSTRTRAMYATLSMLAGPDWAPAGQAQWVTQLAYRPTLGPPPFPTSPMALLLSLMSLIFSSSSLSLTHRSSSSINTSVATWSFPFAISWRSTNPSGWPQVLVSVYGLDALNRDVLVGYATVLVPRHPGRHVVYAPLFVPRASTRLNEWLSWVAGRPPEVMDLAGVFGGEGKNRHVLRVRSDGMVKLVLNVAVKDLDKFGYQFGPSLVGIGGVGMSGGSSGG